MTTRWSAPEITYSRPPAEPPISLGTILGWLILATLTWLTLILIVLYLWSVI